MDGPQVAVTNLQQIPITVVDGSTFGRYPKISGRKVYNQFISDGWLINYSGWKRRIELESSVGQTTAGRGIYRSVRGNLVIAVVNSSVWLLDQNIGASFVGNLATVSGPVFMDENLAGQIGIVDGTYLYIYNRNTNTLTRQTSTIPDELTPNYICYHNTYFLIGNGDTTGNGAKWYVFQRQDDEHVEVAIGGELALETKPDYARAVVRLSEKGNNVLVFGTAVTEVQNNSPLVTGTNTLLYQRVSTINIDYGVLSVATISSSDNMVCWLATNEKSAPVIMYFDGGSHHTISTDGINYVLGSLKNPAKSVGFFYKRDGHLFYQITFYDEADNLSLVYDFNTQKFFHLSDHNLNFHPAREVIFLAQKSFFVSLINGSVYETGTEFTTYDENIPKVGRPNYNQEHNYIIPREIVCANIRLPGAPTPQPYRCLRLTLEAEQGQDLDYTRLGSTFGCSDTIITEDTEEVVITEDGEDIITESAPGCFNYLPGIDFSFSKDGSETWSNEVRRDFNYAAERQNIVQWQRMGLVNEFAPKFKVWTYGRSAIGNAILEVSI